MLRFSSPNTLLRRLGLALLLVLAVGARAATPLYDAEGKAVAFLAEDRVIYLWSGEPIAYLEPAYSSSPSVYSFGGTHLAWVVKGCLRDHQGRLLGSETSPLPTPLPQAEPTAARLALPQKLNPQRAPMRPKDLPQWAPKPLGQVLVEARSC